MYNVSKKTKLIFPKKNVYKSYKNMINETQVYDM